MLVSRHTRKDIKQNKKSRHKLAMNTHGRCVSLNSSLHMRFLYPFMENYFSSTTNLMSIFVYMYYF